MGLETISRGIWVELGVTVALLLNVIAGGRKQKPKTSEKKIDLQSVLRTLPEAVFLFDDRACIADLNQAAEELAGQERSRLLGVPASSLFHGVSQHDLQEPVASRALRGELVLRERQAFHTSSGEPLEVLISVGPMKDSDGQVRGAMLIVQDVTELSALQRQVASCERHFVVGQMTAGLVHDFSNVLNTISQAVNVLESNESHSDHERAMLGIIGNAVRRGSETVGNVRGYLLGSRRKRSRIDIRQMLEEVVQLARPMLENHAGIKVKLALRDCAEVHGNSDELRRAFINLLLNAIEAMPVGGTLTVSCSAVDDQVEVSMTDTGSGIALSDQKMIFSPYFTTKAKGTGLGLAGARRAIEAQGGEIRFESSEGTGTTFYVKLPIANSGDIPTQRAA
jgi:PAS domain S-box-containing protein